MEWCDCGQPLDMPGSAWCYACSQQGAIVYPCEKAGCPENTVRGTRFCQPHLDKYQELLKDARHAYPGFDAIAEAEAWVNTHEPPARTTINSSERDGESDKNANHYIPPGQVGAEGCDCPAPRCRWVGSSFCLREDL